MLLRARSTSAQRCPYCHERLSVAAARVRCGACGTEHHQCCVEEAAGYCTTYGCGQALEERSTIRLVDVPRVRAQDPESRVRASARSWLLAPWSRTSAQAGAALAAWAGGLSLTVGAGGAEALGVAAGAWVVGALGALFCFALSSWVHQIASPEGSS